MKKRTQKCSRRNREDEPPWDTGNPGTHLQIEKAAVRLHERMLGELELLEREQSEAESWSENRLKQLTAFFKALQGMEEMRVEGGVSGYANIVANLMRATFLPKETESDLTEVTSRFFFLQ